ncbi:MAG: carboxylesterase family protein, partial [Clostridiales bacterium]|nr:carboxylesterase family protein [Clostridiales bacterium]
LGASTFAPSVDGDFISGFPICAAQDGKIGGIPILIGVTRDEMSVVLFKSLSKLLDISEVRDVGKQAESEETTRLIMDAYRANRRRAPADMMTDAVFHLPCTWFAGAYSKNAGTWMYRFDYATLSMRIFGLRAFHSSDIPFLFGNFRAGLARYMLLLSPWKGRIGRVHRELQGDFLTFMRKGALPWVKCKGENIHAKYYALPLSEGPVVRAEVKQACDGSEVRRKSLAGEDIVSLP